MVRRSTRKSASPIQVARGGLLARGYTLTSFAEEHGFKLSTVKKAISGLRDGPKSAEVKAALNKILGPASS